MANILVKSSAGVVNLDGSENIVVNSIDWGTSTLSIESVKLKQSESYKTSNMISRNVSMTLYVFANNEADMRSQRQKIQRTLPPFEDITLIGFVPIPGSGSIYDEWELTVRLNSSLKWSSKYAEHNREISMCQVDLVALDPFFRLRMQKEQNTFYITNNGIRHNIAWYINSNSYLTYQFDPTNIRSMSEQEEMLPALAWKCVESSNITTIDVVRRDTSSNLLGFIRASFVELANGFPQPYTLQAGHTIAFDFSGDILHFGDYYGGVCVKDFVPYVVDYNNSINLDARTTVTQGIGIRVTKTDGTYYTNFLSQDFHSNDYGKTLMQIPVLEV